MVKCAQRRICGVPATALAPIPILVAAFATSFGRRSQNRGAHHADRKQRPRGTGAVVHAEMPCIESKSEGYDGSRAREQPSIASLS